jgi:hypothetical protein
MNTNVLGTVSWGTHRPQDLIPRFIEALRDADPAAYAEMVSRPYRPIPDYVRDEGDDSEWWDSEPAGWLLEELFECLQAAAPDGFCFGAHPADGSDLGFWKVGCEP